MKPDERLQKMTKERLLFHVEFITNSWNSQEKRYVARIEKLEAVVKKVLSLLRKMEDQSALEALEEIE